MEKVWILSVNTLGNGPLLSSWVEMQSRISYLNAIAIAERKGFRGSQRLSRENQPNAKAVA
jgi:hypothetical protein